MLIKIDENIPTEVVRRLAELGHDVDSVQQEGLAGCCDDEVFAAAQQAKRFLITQDLDFSDIRKFAPGSHCGIMLVRLREPGREKLTKAILNAFQHENVTSWARGFVVLGEHKIRLHLA